MAKRKLRPCPWCSEKHWKQATAKRCYKKHQAKNQPKWTAKELS